MSFNWAGGSQSPFSPSSSPGWGSEATRPLFGVGPGSSAFAGTTTGSLFATASSSSFASPFSGGSLFSGPSFFSAQSSSSLFAAATMTPLQTSSSFFSPAASQASPLFGPPATQGPFWRAHGAVQSASNAFRDKLYRVVKRKDGRPVTHHTRTDELEETGQHAIQMIQGVQGDYKDIVAEIMSDPYFKRGADLSTLKKEFRTEMQSVKDMISEHQLNVDEFQQSLKAAHPRDECIDQVIREAEHVMDDLDKTDSAAKDGRLYVPESIYRQQLEWPHPFIIQKAMELRPRLGGLMGQVAEVERARSEEHQAMEEEEDEEDLPAFRFVQRLLCLLDEKVSEFCKEVKDAKERYLAERRREGDLSDPFEEASREERIREGEMQTDWQQHTVRIMQPVISFGHSGSNQARSLFGPPATTATGLLGFGQTTGSALFAASSTPALFGAASSQTTSVFGQTTGSAFFAQSSTTPLFGSAASQPSSLFGKTTGTGLFGSSASTTGAGFGAFGAGGAASGGPTLFGQSGFGNMGSSGGVSPGSSVATNLGSSPNRFGTKNNHRSL